MKNKIKVLTLFIGVVVSSYTMGQNKPVNSYHEQYRPQIHFSPKAHWMNDPNGMVYYKGTYHLFFQHYPDGIVWGPMHWGHAVSKDMVHWKEVPVALYPDSLGYIFSGSAVIDSNNTSGFGKDGKVPMVAIFTHHDPKGEKAGRNDFQNESLAYSLDEGVTWTKYAGNPVIKNPGIRDFRDPKVMWYAAGKKWVMTLATLDHITFFSSPDLKNWKQESEFGKTLGAHGGVWECPDLFPMKLNGKTHWVLIVNLNPGGPNGGSATQYFVGDFDGSKFTPADEQTRWLDYGPDEYAGITWNNTGNRRIFLGWMSNWEYANQVPTVKWRNAMTIPREMALNQVDNGFRLSSVPVTELSSLTASKQSFINVPVAKDVDVTAKAGKLPGQYILKLNANTLKEYKLTLSNNKGNELVVGYDAKANQYYIDRTKSGKVDFQKDFPGRFTAPRFSTVKSTDLTLVVDAASVELFADHGLTVMTAIFFPDAPYSKLSISSPGKFTLNKMELIRLKSAWLK